MKTLYLVRHAKSSWDNPNYSDIERPLNKRGKREAPFMGKLLKKEKAKPDIIYSSPAVRASTTAEIIAKEISYPEEKIVRDENIYESGIKELEEIIQGIPNDNTVVMLFGHNPGLTHFVNHLGDKYIDNMPTCSIVGIEFDVNSWREVERNKGKIFLFEYPKKYFGK